MFATETSRYNLSDAGLTLTFEESYVKPLVCFALYFSQK